MAGGSYKASSLTRREVEVLKLIAAGMTSKEIARALEITFKTVVCHRTHVLQKIDADGIADLTRYAVRNQLIPLDVSAEEQSRQRVRTSQRQYMEALTNYNQFVAERRESGLSAPDAVERRRQLFREEQRLHAEYTAALRLWADFVLRSKE